MNMYRPISGKISGNWNAAAITHFKMGQPLQPASLTQTFCLFADKMSNIHARDSLGYMFAVLQVQHLFLSSTSLWEMYIRDATGLHLTRVFGLNVWLLCCLDCLYSCKWSSSTAFAEDKMHVQYSGIFGVGPPRQPLKQLRRRVPLRLWGMSKPLMYNLWVIIHQHFPWTPSVCLW